MGLCYDKRGDVVLGVQMTSRFWMDGMSVGVRRFDQAHQGFFELLDRIQEAVARTDWKSAHRDSEALAVLAVRHGEEEEYFLRENGYHGMAGILHAQKVLQGHAEEMTSLLYTHPQDALDAVDRLRHQLILYLLHGDVNYKSFVLDKGLSDLA